MNLRGTVRIAVLLIGLLAAATASHATVVTPYQFTITQPGGVQMAPDGISSLPVFWSFVGLPSWDQLFSIDSVTFNLRLGQDDPARPSSFSYQLADTLTLLIGPQTPVIPGGTTQSHVHSVTITDADVLGAIFADGTFQTMLFRDPGWGDEGQDNYFLYLGSSVSINAQIVPEPGTFLMLGAGMVGLALLVRRRGGLTTGAGRG